MSNDIAIKDFKQKKAYDRLIERKINQYFYELFFKPLLAIAKLKSKNDYNVIIESLDKGIVIYNDGVFKPQEKLSNVLSLEFEKAGAKWNKNLRGYEFKEMPNWLNYHLGQMQLRTQEKLAQMNGLLSDFETNMDHYIDTMIFDEEVVQILDDTGKQIKKNIKHLNIIEPEFTEEQKKQIAKDYTNNMQFYIKKWSVKNIVELRQKIQKLILDGYREADAQKILKEEFQKIIEKNLKTENPFLTVKQLQRKAKIKARFLAQNETSIMLAQVKKQMYTEIGFEEFKWATILDGRERLNHHELNGRIFRFDNPPIIDERTGQRGLPGETYNCRCTLIPYRRDNVFDV